MLKLVEWQLNMCWCPTYAEQRSFCWLTPKRCQQTQVACSFLSIYSGWCLQKSENNLLWSMKRTHDLAKTKQHGVIFHSNLVSTSWSGLLIYQNIREKKWFKCREARLLCSDIGVTCYNFRQDDKGSRHKMGNTFAMWNR